MLRLLSAMLIIFGITAVPPALACGPDTPCTVANGEYLIRMPSAWNGRDPVPAVMFFHGWQSSAAEVMADQVLAKSLSDLGLALIAPNGREKAWSFPNSPSHDRDEFQFVAAVLDDAAQRFAIDKTRILASGFSIGGSMVWNLACYMGDRFLAFEAIAGAFWDPAPSDCPSAAPNLLHIHGTSDRTVPLEGRVILNMFRQSDVNRSLLTWLKACPKDQTQTVEEGLLHCVRHVGCTNGNEIEFCLHNGGHEFRAEWVADAWKWVEADVMPLRNRHALSPGGQGNRQ
jgi:polyhydroxybutyrate depolymerase